MLEALRYTVFAVFVAAAAVAFGARALQTRRINPFGRLARVVRTVGDPILRPIERWQLRRGGNPQNAPWWLLGFALVGGIVAVTLAEWLATLAQRIGGAVSAGPRSILRLLVYYASQLVLLALIVRVIGSWFGVGRYHRWMRPAYRLTDWIVEPLRRVIPPIGFVDITPIVAWLIIQFLFLPLILRLL
jgi:YggT family protein